MGLLFADFRGEQILETVLRLVGRAIVRDRQTSVQITVILQALGDVLVVPGVLLEDLGIGREADVGAVRFLGLAAFFVLLTACFFNEGVSEDSTIPISVNERYLPSSSNRCQ